MDKAAEVFEKVAIKWPFTKTEPYIEDLAKKLKYLYGSEDAVALKRAKKIAKALKGPMFKSTATQQRKVEILSEAIGKSGHGLLERIVKNK